MIREAISKVVDRIDLSEEETYSVMEEIMSGQCTPAQIGSIITALRLKGETVSEITGAARLMRDKAVKIKIPENSPVVDTCGTGGDRAATFNISTIAAFIVAGCDITVAKHGNRAISSKCGSADLLEALGVNINAGIENVEKCISSAGIGFMFAPLFHGAMKNAIGPRREIGIRTIFNVLGPLTNPSGARSQLLGVYDEKLTVVLASALKNLGSNHAFIVHGKDGLDELTITDSSTVSELKDGHIKTYEVSPEDFGFKRASLKDLQTGDMEQNVKIANDILNGSKGPCREVVLMNASAAIVVSGRAGSLKEGISMAEKSIDSGKARMKLDELVKCSRS